MFSNFKVFEMAKTTKRRNNDQVRIERTHRQAASQLLNANGQNSERMSAHASSCHSAYYSFVLRKFSAVVIVWF